MQHEGHIVVTATIHPSKQVKRHSLPKLGFQNISGGPVRGRRDLECITEESTGCCAAALPGRAESRLAMATNTESAPMKSKRRAAQDLAETRSNCLVRR